MVTKTVYKDGVIYCHYSVVYIQNLLVDIYACLIQDHVIIVILVHLILKKGCYFVSFRHNT